MKIAVTGGSGFIGTPLVKALLEQGHHVRVIDLKQPIFQHKHLEFVSKSIMDDLKDSLKDCGMVYHLAAMLGVEHTDKRPLETIRINLEGSVNVFKCAAGAGIKNMVYASSSEVYGNPRELPIREESVKGPVSTYGVSKLASEIYAQAYNKEFGTNIKIVRFFNVYGPGQSDEFVVSIFLNNALLNKPIRVFGDGSQTRCFTYVQDAVDGALKVAEKGEDGEAYNVGNNHPTTILQLAETIREVAGSSSEIIKVGYGKDSRLRSREIDYRIPDISKISALGWEPKTRIAEGVRKILEWKKTGLKLD